MDELKDDEGNLINGPLSCSYIDMASGMAMRSAARELEKVLVHLKTLNPLYTAQSLAEDVALRIRDLDKAADERVTTYNDAVRESEAQIERLRKEIALKNENREAFFANETFVWLALKSIGFVDELIKKKSKTVKGLAFGLPENRARAMETLIEIQRALNPPLLKRKKSRVVIYIDQFLRRKK